jgi:two-component system, LytTR family, response regulator
MREDEGGRVSSGGRIKTLVVDDEPLARRNLRVLLEADPEIELVGEAAGGAQALALISEHSPDLVFLDVQMPETDGFGVLERLEAGRLPVVIFVTAFDKYALKAFDFHALDYLLKPFDDSRFEKALARAKRQLAQRELKDLSRRLISLLEDRAAPHASEHEGATAEKPARYQTRFLIKSGGRVSFVRADEVDWIEADDYYVKLHVKGRGHLLRETMNDVESRLDPEVFVRIHRSSIVNMERVRELQQMFGGDYSVVLHDGTQLKLSRARRERLESLLKTGRS